MECPHIAVFLNTRDLQALCCTSKHLCTVYKFLQNKPLGCAVCHSNSHIQIIHQCPKVGIQKICSRCLRNTYNCPYCKTWKLELT